jgi:hypothetical protein
LQEADRLEPVRVKKTRYIRNPEPRFDSIETEMLWESGARKDGLRPSAGRTRAALSHALVTNRYQRRARRRLKNFSRNRPETTNLNHQYAIRRVDICRILDAPSGPASWIAPKPETGCDMVHIGGRKPAGRMGRFSLIAESFAARIHQGRRPAPPIAAWLSGTCHSSCCDRYRDLRGDCARRHRNDDRLHRQGYFRGNQSR